MCRPKVIRHDISDYERRQLQRLAQCSMLPGSFDKRFVRDLAGTELISEKQQQILMQLVHRYRKQLARIAEQV